MPNNLHTAGACIIDLHVVHEAVHPLRRSRHALQVGRGDADDHATSSLHAGWLQTKRLCCALEGARRCHPLVPSRQRETGHPRTEVPGVHPASGLECGKLEAAMHAAGWRCECRTTLVLPRFAGREYRSDAPRAGPLHLMAKRVLIYKDPVTCEHLDCVLTLVAKVHLVPPRVRIPLHSCIRGLHKNLDAPRRPCTFLGQLLSTPHCPVGINWIGIRSALQQLGRVKTITNRFRCGS
mmetsp:Transcript_29803/g.77114  ORF Transcript_29803/g.77114 Transcript_29803/m.77114 type:complete len:237 (+) Transcript_29803:726-1436(+)